MSRTLIPTVSAKTSVPFTRQRPCWLWLAKCSSMWSGFVFIVRSVNHVSSKSRIVLPGQCLMTSPTVKSSSQRPMGGALIGIRRRHVKLASPGRRLLYAPRADGKDADAPPRAHAPSRPRRRSARRGPPALVGGELRAPDPSPAGRRLADRASHVDETSLTVLD